MSEGIDTAVHDMRHGKIILGKRVAHRTHGNAGPVTGDIAGTTIVVKNVVRCCETPEYFARHGCPHRGDVSRETT